MSIKPDPWLYMQLITYGRILMALAKRNGGRVEVTKEELDGIDMNAEIRIHERQDGTTFEVKT